MSDLNFFADLTSFITKDVNGDVWMLEGIASTHHIDLFGDVILPEKFQEHLDFFVKKGMIYYNHGYIKKDEDADGRTPIGRPVSAELTEEGLKIKCVLNQQHPIAQKLWNETFTHPDPLFSQSLGLSIGAKPLGKTQRVWSIEKQKYVNYLPEMALYEVSITEKPVNPNTWVTMVKGMIEEASLENKVAGSVQISPEEITHDQENNLIVVKSSFQDEAGNTFEVVIPVNKEEILKSMADNPFEDKDKKPDATPADDGGAPEAKPDTDPAPVDAPGGDAPAPDAPGGDPPADPGAPAGDAPGGDMPPADPAAGGDAPPADPAGDPAAPTDPDPTGGINAALNDPAAAGDPNAAQPGQGADMGLMNDKMDTLIDPLTNLTAMVAKITSPANGQVDMSPPSNAISSNDPGQMAIKSVDVLIEGEQPSILKAIENMLVNHEKAVFESVQALLANHEPVVKSVDAPQTVVIRQPDVALATNNLETVANDAVTKSVDEDHEIVLKGLIEEYVNIKGGTQKHAYSRAEVKARAQNLIGMTPTEFARQVSVFERGSK